MVTTASPDLRPGDTYGIVPLNTDWSVGKAGQIAAGAIGVGCLAANSVIAGTVAAGAVTASSLAVGTSINQCPNSDFSSGNWGWGSTAPSWTNGINMGGWSLLNVDLLPNNGLQNTQYANTI